MSLEDGSANFSPKKDMVKRPDAEVPFENSGFYESEILVYTLGEGCDTEKIYEGYSSDGFSTWLSSQVDDKVDELDVEDAVVLENYHNSIVYESQGEGIDFDQLAEEVEDCLSRNCSE